MGGETTTAGCADLPAVSSCPHLTSYVRLSVLRNKIPHKVLCCKVCFGLLEPVKDVETLLFASVTGLLRYSSDMHVLSEGL